MRIVVLSGILFAMIAYSDTTTTYRWPIPPNQGGNSIISNYCDYRPAGPHFHEGLDIKVDSTRTQDVVSITYGFQVRSITHDPEYEYIVKVRHYFDDLTGSHDHGSNYIHMDSHNDSLMTDSVYQGVYISHQTTFWRNHLHLEYRSLSIGGGGVASRNPFLLSELPIRVADSRSPILKALYVDYSCHGNAEVESLNFLSYEFDGYYGDTTYQGITFKKLTLPAETQNNDRDDPHILISGNRQARFVLEAHDNISRSDDRAAPYVIALYLDGDIVNRIKPLYMLRFDTLSEATNEVHQAEDVYHVSAPLISGIDAPQYYRLYPCDSVIYGLPSCVITDTALVDTILLQTENLDEGMHRIRVYAQDYERHEKTGDMHFYIRKSDWVDFCRGFKE